MPYRMRASPRVTRQIRSWLLPPEVDGEVFVRLYQTLPRNPPQVLVRARQPWDGMVYYFDLVDPKDRFCEHRFWFLVHYHQDEEYLIVSTGAYHRTVGI